MCWCTPSLRTPFCGKPECARPERPAKHFAIAPVEMPAPRLLFLDECRPQPEDEAEAWHWLTVGGGPVAACWSVEKGWLPLTGWADWLSPKFAHESGFRYHAVAGVVMRNGRPHALYFKEQGLREAA